MEITKTEIDGLLIVTPKAFIDDRGYFMETFNETRYREAGIVDRFVQDNVSVSCKDTLRGLHYQAPPCEQGKLVQVLRGRVWDVAVDIRMGSPTFGKYVGVDLSSENKKQFWIPAGFAHGFLVVEDDTIFSYKCTNSYAPDSDRGLAWNDPFIAIAWPLDVGVAPKISEKDNRQPRLQDIPAEFSLDL
jgi:dTDP-4-dehydrorhamnose 3,5-epimerase